MIVLVCYDITVNKRRAKVSARLQSYGERIQESVFVLDVAKLKYAKARDEIVQVCDLDEDRIFFLPLCKTCHGNLEAFGQMMLPDNQLGWFVL